MSMTPELRPYLRDVHDHLHLISEKLLPRRTSSPPSCQANMAVISVEQTRVSRAPKHHNEQLTIWRPCSCR